MNKIKTIFFGSGEFAVPILRKLSETDFIDLQAVVTQPDKPVGRKQIMTPTPVGQAAASLESRVSSPIDLLKPEKLKEVSDAILEKYSPELIIVASYGQIIPHNIVHYPKHRALNFHGSILPKLRGAVPVQMAILEGLKETGVTLQVMEDGMDEGDIIAISSYEIKEDDTSESLMSALAELSVGMIENELQRYLSGEITPQKQDESSATYCYKTDLNKERAEITSETTIKQADMMIRAFYPWPIAWTVLENGKVLKIYKAKFTSEVQGDKKIFRSGKQLFLKLKDGYLELLEVQLEGKNRGEGKDYLYLG